MKKFLSPMLTLCLILSLASLSLVGCGNAGSGATSGTASGTSAYTESNSSDGQSDTAAEDYADVSAEVSGESSAEAASENSEQDAQSDTSQSNTVNSPQTGATSRQSDGKLPAFDKTAVIEETVMIDENDIKITATGLNYTNYSVELELTIENNSGKNLSFISGSLGYCCNSINGYMLSDGYLNCDVAGGKKANDTISFKYDSLQVYGINEIADIEIGFDVSDDDYNHTYYEPKQVKTSIADSHDYSGDVYQETITSPAAINTYGYDITYFSTDTLYDVNGIKLLSSGMMVNRSGEPTLLLEFENTTDNIAYLSTTDISLNGLLVYTSTWSSDAINPGKRAIIDIDSSSILDKEYWDVYGIKDVGSISLTVNQLDSKGADIADPAAIEIAIPDVEAAFDSNGAEIYSDNGLRIVSKTVLDDPSSYSSDLHVLLLAENTSGKTLTIKDEYNSLSVNGFMTDYSFYSKTRNDGQCAALEIRLWGSSLEDNKIASADEVEEIELSLDIRDGRDTIDKPTVKMSFGK